MTSNNGAKLIVLGLSYGQHDNRQMQQILGHFGRLPPAAGPPNRGSLFIALTKLSKDLRDDEITGVESWMRDGGSLPYPRPDAFPDARDTTPRKGTTPYNPMNHGHGGHVGYGGGRVNPWDNRANAWGDTAMQNDDDEEEDEEFDRQARRPTAEGPRRENEEAEDQVMEEDDNEGSFYEDAAEHVQQDQVTDSMNVTGEMEDVENENGNGQTELTQRPRGVTWDDQLSGVTSGSGSQTMVVNIIECPICCEDLVSDDFPESNPTSNCEHKEKVCLSCIRLSIEEAVNDGAIHRLFCPLCAERLSYDNVLTYSSQEAWQKYDYLLMSSDADTVLCLGPNCGAGQTHKVEEDGPMMTCHSCNFETCASHKLPWHPGMTCVEFDCDESQIERLEQEEATAKVLAGTSRVCPDCGQGVQKQDGCDHLTCRCGGEWCFVCMASYENLKRFGETAHAPTCSYHPNKVRTSKYQEEATRDRMTQLVHGGPVSEALQQARQARNARIRAEVRPLALEAAEKRMKEAREQAKARELDTKESNLPKRRKTKLVPAWEEGGLTKRTF